MSKCKTLALSCKNFKLSQVLGVKKQRADRFIFQGAFLEKFNDNIAAVFVFGGVAFRIIKPYDKPVMARYALKLLKKD